MACASGLFRIYLQDNMKLKTQSFREEIKMLDLAYSGSIHVQGVPGVWEKIQCVLWHPQQLW